MSHFRSLTFIFLLFFAAPIKAEELGRVLDQTDFYFLIDADSGAILLSKNADKRIAPSSMTKLMTAYVVFKQIKNGYVELASECFVGKDAWRKTGSSMFLNYGDVVSVDHLLQGLLVVSGNDAAVALAESTAGGADKFVALMNKTAQEIGLKNSHFSNPHGLNQRDHYMTLRDLATLASRLYKDFPQYSHYFGIQEFTYQNITQRNRNPLIRTHYDGIVGGKTGYTNDGGYGVVGVVKRNHRRLIGVINKTRSPRQRTRAITELLNYGFQSYKKLILFQDDQTITKLPTWLGTKSRIEAITKKQIAINIPRSLPLSEVKVSIKYKTPIYAPIKANEKIADLIVEIRGYKKASYPLFAKEKVKKAGRIRRVSQIMIYKIHNFLNKIF